MLRMMLGWGEQRCAQWGCFNKVPQTGWLKTEVPGWCGSVVER